MTRRISACYGKCMKYATTKAGHDGEEVRGERPYIFGDNVRHCRKCDIYMKYSYYRCPCCKFPLRSKVKK